MRLEYSIFRLEIRCLLQAACSVRIRAGIGSLFYYVEYCVRKICYGICVNCIGYTLFNDLVANNVSQVNKWQNGSLCETVSA